MKQNARILVVEDDASVVVFLVDQMEHMGYRVDVARNGIQALRQVEKQLPDLIILDVMMPEMDGYEVCQKLRSGSQTKHIPILMLTAKGQKTDTVLGLKTGADDYLAKPYDKAELEARVQALLRRSQPPYPIAVDHCYFNLQCTPGQRVGIRHNGPTSVNLVGEKVLTLQPETYARLADNTAGYDWRFNSKYIGEQLYRLVFSDHPEVHGSYNQACGEIATEEYLHLSFETERELLRIPFEFLFDNITQSGEYLALRHPVARSIRSVRVKRRPVSPQFLNDLVASDGHLRILLVGSNTIPRIAGVDHEIDALSSLLGRVFRERGVPVVVDMVRSEVATYENIRRILKESKYHIVHYAGHGTYDRQSPEQSYLSFWEKENCQGSVIRMKATELQMLLRTSDVRFVYLSCCYGAATGPDSALLADDFLGIADSIIHGGVPTVLGFRWAVSDAGAKALSVAFYLSLAEQGQIDTALFKARCEVAGTDRDDITWLSPILIMQT